MEELLSRHCGGPGKREGQVGMHEAGCGDEGEGAGATSETKITVPQPIRCQATVTGRWGREDE